MKQYEAMFLFDQTFGGTHENCETEIRRLMDRAGAKIILCRKWDERRLAYRVKGRKRGVYVLTFFEAPPESITPLERDAKLSEDVLRMLVVRAEGMTKDAMEKAYVIPEETSPRGSWSRDGDWRGGPGRGGERRTPPASAPTATKEALATDVKTPSSPVTGTAEAVAKPQAKDPGGSTNTAVVAEPPADKPTVVD